MKQVSVVMVTWVLFLIAHLGANAQSSEGRNVKWKVIDPLEIAVSYNKTSNLIFPFPIISVDRGSAAILAQKAKGAENILQVKAGRMNFTETNLSVITADAQLYSFLVDYSDEPSVLNVSFYKDTLRTASPVTLPKGQVNMQEYSNIADSVKKASSFLNYRTNEQKVRLSLRSIYVSENAMWFNFRIRNRSLIDYTPDYIRAFVRDKKKVKRTAIQEKEITPVFNIPYSSIKGRGDQHIVIAYPSFTIPKDQELVFQIGEKNGGRSLTLVLNHKAILQAKLLND
ncbi:MAG: conjugative transposon protein TraN [Chitinophagaceae bacterium]|nr:MAG: conjugative transposon protein TraN [Chitinophagaceae bacterium]